ncbi:MAG: polysaccharide biosynthesis tyrosine autokinase [Ignavibacteriae bacterium]|nr:polysaccharide biosynthesis tyrosine autokinase [Ignavibacteriota bacterium]
MANNNSNGFNNNDKSYIRELMAEEESHSLMDYVNIIRHHQLAVMLISLAVLTLAIIYAVTSTDIYKASTTLKISEPQGSILDASSFLPEFAGGGKADRFIANEIETIKNITLREQVATVMIDSFTLGKNKDIYSLILSKDYFESKNQGKLKSYEDILGLLEKKVSIEQKRGLDFIEVSVESPSPKEAALIANTYASVYREFNLLDNRKQVSKVKEFLARQKDEKLNQLVSAEDDLKNYQLKGGVVELNEQAKSLIETITDLQAKINSTSIEMSIAKENLLQFREEMDRIDPTLSKYLENKTSEPYILRLQEQIAEIETQKDFALTSNGEITNPRVLQDFDEKLVDLKTKLKNKVKEFQQSILASSPEEIKALTKRIFEEQVKYEGLSASHTQLKEFIKGYNNRFEMLPERTIDLARLTREATAYEKLYLLLEEKYQGALITEQSTTGNVLVLNNARVPRFPSKPNRKLIILIGLVLGLGLAFGYALLMNFFDRTIKSPDDIEDKNINLLGWIPKVDTSKLEGHGTEFVVANNTDSVASEAFKALRTRIRYSKIEGDAKTILITSSAPGEGKSTISANLAGSFALSNRRTVIVDCDLRKPRVHNIFNQKRFPGFTDYFVGRATFEEIQRTSDIENLLFIPAGTIPPNPSEILDSRGMKSFIGKLTNEFDIVILDSPPVLTVTDAEILSRIVDETILVVSANVTDVELMSKSVALLGRGEDSSFIGALLNRFEVQSSYGSYYKYAYAYVRNNDKENKKTILKKKKEEKVSENET